MSQATNIMTCDEYKEEIAADPAFDGGAGHLTECTDCQAFRDEMLAFDRKLAAAMDLGVPTLTMPELPEIDTDNVTPLSSRRSRAPMWYAVAATVLVAVFVGVQLTDVEPSGESLASQLLAHIDHEPYAKEFTTQAVSDSRLARVVPAKIATMDHDAGLITYAQSCRINGHEVPHLVIHGKRGPITILLMPEEMVEENSAIEGDNVEGYILQVGDGSIAIIGEKHEEQLELIKREVLDSVRWGSST